MNANAIECRQVSVTMGQRRLLAIDRWTVASGEIVALMGPNGAGKTTLLRCLLGLQPHAGGTILVLGQSVHQLGWRGLAHLRRQLGYVPQLLPAPSQLPLTVREVVAIGRTGKAGLFHRLNRADWHLVDYWLERLGLSALATRLFSETSGGEQRKTVLARAMVQEPKVLLLDEPTAHLDLRWRERLVDTIEALHQEFQLTVLLVCHEPEVIPKSCRQVVWLGEGRIVRSGKPEEVLTPDWVRSVFGRGLVVEHRQGRHVLLPQGGPP